MPELLKIRPGSRVEAELEVWIEIVDYNSLGLSRKSGGCACGYQTPSSPDQELVKGWLNEHLLEKHADCVEEENLPG